MHTTQIAQIHGTKGEMKEQITNPSAESPIRLVSPPIASSRSSDSAESPRRLASPLRAPLTDEDDET